MSGGLLWWLGVAGIGVAACLGVWAVALWRMGR
jgi:hypothetical protein